MKETGDPAPEVDDVVQAARRLGALYHPTNPMDAWFCRRCQVFGFGGRDCWSCGTTALDRQWIPALGGGSESVTWLHDAA